MQMLMWFSLFILSSLASSCWTRAFEPQFGASWHDPWWTEYFDIFIYVLAGCYPSFSPRNTIFQPSIANSGFVLCLIQVAWLQMIQWCTSLVVNQWQAFALRLLLIDCLRGHSIYCMIPWRNMPSKPGTQQALSNQTSSIRVALLAAFAAHWCVYSTPRLDFSDFILNNLVPWIPYQLLPSGFLAFGIVTTVSATMAVVSARGSKWHGNRPQSFASRLLLAGTPILCGLLMNPHSPIAFTTSITNTRLGKLGYELLARGDGRATGYVSVLQNNKDGFRVLRCGHSLLGGYWLNSPGIVKDPIYGVFVMLEAVRLIEPADATESVIARQERLAQSGSVLVIGLGIGTAPAAFIHHGMDVTIVEIDQIVYDYAVEYFDLPPRHKAIIGDAIEFVHAEQTKLATTPRQKNPSAARGSNAVQYDFIVHDVFTGGVEPAELFTVEFLTGLKDLLRPYGAIAINYAGDFKLPSTRMVLRTILAVFPACRMFRETAEGAESSESDSDQTNVVLFCRKVVGKFAFRQPTQDDFLGAPSREQWLMPEHEVAVDGFKPDCTHDVD